MKGIHPAILVDAFVLSKLLKVKEKKKTLYIHSNVIIID